MTGKAFRIGGMESPPRITEPISNDSDPPPAMNWPKDGKPHKVAENCIFTLDGHRTDSIDSCVWGDVPLQLVIGRVR